MTSEEFRKLIDGIEEIARLYNITDEGRYALEKLVRDIAREFLEKQN